MEEKCVRERSRRKEKFGSLREIYGNERRKKRGGKGKGREFRRERRFE